MSKVQPSREWRKIEIVGLCILIVSLAVLMIKPSVLGDLFNKMFDRAYLFSPFE